MKWKVIYSLAMRRQGFESTGNIGEAPFIVRGHSKASALLIRSEDTQVGRAGVIFHGFLSSVNSLTQIREVPES